MGIKYFEKHKVFKLDAKDTSYIIAIVDEEQFLGHVYFGKRIIDENVNYLIRIEEPPYVPSKNNRDRVSFYDIVSSNSLMPTSIFIFTGFMNIYA